MNTANTAAYADGQGTFLLLIMICLYFIPAIVGFSKGKNNAGAIFLLNLFLGWTFIGWVVALIWAATNDPHKDINHALGCQNKAIKEAFQKKQRIEQAELKRRDAMINMKWDD